MTAGEADGEIAHNPSTKKKKLKLLFDLAAMRSNH
jgi:hypothetical protein